MEDLFKRNKEKNGTASNTTVVLASKEFYRHRIMKEVLKPDGTSLYDLKNLGHNDKWLSLYITAVYVGILFLMGYSHRLSGKVSWATILVPTTLLSVIIFRAMTLPGSFTGIEYICKIKIDIGALLDFQTWQDASLQALTSAGAGYGFHLTISSYNEFNLDGLMRNAIIIICMDFLLSVLATLLGKSLIYL